MNNRGPIFVIAACLSCVPCALFTSSVSAQTKQGTKVGTLEANLATLNLFEEKPEGVQRLYRMAYEILAADRQATFAQVAQNHNIQLMCRELGMRHWGGPMLGAVTAQGVRVWLRTLEPAQVEVRVTVDSAEKSFGPVASTVESDLTAVVSVTGLKPNTRYLYRVLVDGQAIVIPEHAAIVTPPDTARNGRVRITFGSCFHRWGLGNQDQTDQILSRNPAAMLLLGDIAVQDRNNHLGLHRADYLMRDLHPAWSDLVASVPVFATWDDHDYFDNDKAGIPKGYAEQDAMQVCDVFYQNWNNPSYGFNDERRGVFLHTRIGPCDVIMVDERYFRKNQKGSFLGQAQMDWLEQQLLACRGSFIILSCGTMWSDYVSKGKDSWGTCDPQGRERIFNLIEKHHIGGVLLISGDRHGARGFRIPRASGFEFYEFEAASLGGRSGPAVKRPEWTTQLYGIAGQYAFGEFSMDATLADPEVTFRLIRDNGAMLYSITLTRSQLTP